MRLLEMFCVVVATTVIALSVAAQASPPISIIRLPGSAFAFSNFSLTSSSQILVDCDAHEQLVESAHVRSRNEEDVPGVCGGGGDPALVRGSLCLGNDQFCFVRNFTCCGRGLKAQEYGLASMDGRIELCKAVDDGWKTRLNIFSVTDRWQPGLNVISGVQYRVDNAILPFLATQRYRIEIESEISSLSPIHFQALQIAFDGFCVASAKHCIGERQPATEEQTGSLACFSPPSDGFDSIRSWLESVFPILTVDIGTEGSVCVSPWSYFVPVARKIFCVGMISSKRELSVLGSNMLEGHSITFLGNGRVHVSVANSDNCIVSSLCRSALRTHSPSGKTSGLTSASESPSMSPTRPIPVDTTESDTTSALLTPSPEPRTPDEETISPSIATLRPTKKPTSRAPTRRPTIAVQVDDASSGGEPFPPVDAGGEDDDTDITPLIWFGVGSGLTFVLNCVLFLYCRCCRNSRSQHKFARLPAGDVEMTAPVPPVIQVSQTNPNKVMVESTSNSKVPLTAIISAAAAPFEQNPVLAGGAAAFEKAWNQGLIVDVWGITLRLWQPGSIVDSLKHLRLLRVASGTVSGVDKMYWVAKQRPMSLSSPEILGMIEISVDLTTKRLSAVFKMSRSSPTNTARDAQPLHDLFDAFKRVIEEVLC